MASRRVVIHDSDDKDVAPAWTSVRRPGGVPGYRRFLWAVLLLLMGYGVWWIGAAGYYTPGSVLGYNLGLAGGVCMLLLFTYPLRKYVRFMRGWGAIKYWFGLHMTLGVLGPTLILLHATWRIDSLNAGFAFFSMLIVAASGVIGRYIYVKLHRGVYGERLNLQQIRAEAGTRPAEAQLQLRAAPAVQEKLQNFEAEAELLAQQGFKKPLRLLLFGVRAYLLRLRCARELRQVFKERARQEGWSTRTRLLHYQETRRWVVEYIQHAQRMAQFGAYERLFSLWHVLHVPFVYMLVLTAIAHVIAVHMY